MGISKICYYDNRYYICCKLVTLYDVSLIEHYHWRVDSLFSTDFLDELILTSRSSLIRVYLP
jgi:hypothetical protein